VTVVAPILETWFTERLTRQRGASPNTIAAYRDTTKMLVVFAARRARTRPSNLDLSDIDAATVAAFLDHLEADRGNSISTRNARLAAIHSLFHWAALGHPEHAELIARVLAIPPKRHQRKIVTWLTEPEIEALIAACDPKTWTGRRDRTLIVVAAQTGLRISELTGLRCTDVHLGVGAHLACEGKGRKQRITPLATGTVAMLRAWLNERAGQPTDPLFPTSTGRALSRDAVEHRLALHAAVAAKTCPSLKDKPISAHTLRHSAAMRLRHAGVDTSVIALWLGHEQADTTQIYQHADMTIKEQALARTTPLQGRPGRYQPPDKILAFLEAL
jgi:integrase/recombinase XerD